MKKHFKTLVVLTTILLSLSGCASIVHRGKQDIKVSSQPGSSISIKDSYGNTIIEGEETLSIKLDRAKGFFEKGSYVIEVKKAGYKPVTMALTGQVNKGSYVVGNLFSWGIIGWVIVDPLTGAMWTLTTPDVQESDNIKIVLKEDATGEMLDKAKKIN